MPTESEIIIAFIFNRSGKTKLSFSEFYLALSMDLNWFTPQQAKDFLKNAIKQNLVKEENETIQPSFDINMINIPVGFYPTKKIFNEKKESVSKELVKENNVLQEIINKIVQESNLNKKQIEDEIRTIEKEKNLTPEVAALLIGKEHDIKLDEFYEPVEKHIFT